MQCSLYKIWHQVHYAREKLNLVWEVQWQGRTAHRPCTRGSGGRGSCRSSCRCRSPAPPPPALQSCGSPAWVRLWKFSKILKWNFAHYHRMCVQSAGNSCQLNFPITFILCSATSFATECNQQGNWVWIHEKWQKEEKSKGIKNAETSKCNFENWRQVNHILEKNYLAGDYPSPFEVKLNLKVNNFLMNSTKTAKCHIRIRKQVITLTSPYIQYVTIEYYVRWSDNIW